MAWYDDVVPVIAGVGTGVVTGNPALGIAAYSGSKAVINGIENSGGGSSGGGPPPVGAAPQIDPNAGIGQGSWGGMTQGEQQAYQQQVQADRAQAMNDYAQKNPGAMAYIQRTKAAADRARAQGNTAAADQLDAAYQNQLAGIQHDAQDLYYKAPTGPDLSDPGRFAAQAQDSLNRTGPAAPQAGRVNLDPNAGLADYANYQQDRGQFSQGAQSFAQDRSQLGGVADAVRQRALGLGGPSVAELQLQQGNQMAMQNALSIANSQRGGGGSLASIEALRSNAGQTQSYNQQAAMLRAQEQMGAQGQYANMNTAQQGLDINAQNAWLGAGAQDLGARNQSFGQGLQAGQFQVGQNQFNTGLDAARQQQQQQLNAMREQQYLNAYMQSRGMQQGNSQFNATLQAGNQGLAQSSYFQQQQLNQQRQQYEQQQQNALLNMGATALAGYATRPQPAASPAPSPAPNPNPDLGY